MTSAGIRRRALLTAAAVAAVAVGTVAPTPAPAQAPVLPQVTIAGDIHVQKAVGYIDCDDVEQLDETMDGYVLVSRNDPPGASTDPVEVGVTYSGDLADDLIDPVTSVTVEANARYTGITFAYPTETPAASTLTISLAPGPDYELGDPSEASVAVTYELTYVEDCTKVLALPAGVADQTITVGETPVDLPPVTQGEDSYRIVGAPPAGLTLGEDGRWSGAATAPGTATLEVNHCTYNDVVRPDDLPQTLCDGTAYLEITVEAAGAGPANPTAPAAIPVTAAATLTG